MVDDLLCRHLLGECFGIGDHALQFGVAVPLVKHFGAENFARRVYLPIFDVALVARRENQRGVFAIDLTDVVVDVAGFVEVVGDDEVGRFEAWQPRKQHGGRRTSQPINRHHTVALRRQQFFDSGNSRLVVENIT